VGLAGFADTDACQLLVLIGSDHQLVSNQVEHLAVFIQLGLQELVVDGSDIVRTLAALQDEEGVLVAIFLVPVIRRHQNRLHRAEFLSLDVPELTRSSDARSESDALAGSLFRAVKLTINYVDMQDSGGVLFVSPFTHNLIVDGSLQSPTLRRLTPTAVLMYFDFVVAISQMIQ